MKVRLNTSRAGTTAEGEAFAQNVGEVIEVTAEEAKRMLEDGQAEAVAEKRVQKAEKRASPAASR